MVQHLLAVTERKFPNVVDRDAVSDIEVAVAVPRAGIPSIRSVAGIGLELLWRIVEAVGVRVCSLHTQALQQAAFEAGLQSVVVAVPIASVYSISPKSGYGMIGAGFPALFNGVSTVFPEMSG